LRGVVEDRDQRRPLLVGKKPLEEQGHLGVVDMHIDSKAKIDPPANLNFGCPYL